MTTSSKQLETSTRSRATARLKRTLEKDLAAYIAAASAAGVGVLASAQPAEAKIIYTPAHVVLRNHFSNPLDLNNDGYKDFAIWMSTSTWGRTNGSTGGSASLLVNGATSQGQVVGTNSSASALRAGFRIGSKARFPGNDSVMVYDKRGVRSSLSGQWWNNGKGVRNRYLGFKFQFNNEVHYGWARLNVKITHPIFRATLTGYAYETIPNKAIIAGKTKGPDVVTVQPASLGHLARGASATSNWHSNQVTTTSTR